MNGDALGGFVVGVVAATLALAMFQGGQWPTQAEDAKAACVARGYHSGRYDSKQGFVCFNYVSEPFRP